MNKKTAALKNGQGSGKSVFTRGLLVICVAVLLCAIFPVNAFASGGNQIAENGAKWILDGLFWVLVVGGLFATIMLAVKRNMWAALGTFLATCIVGVIIKNPNIIVTIGTMLKDALGL